MIGVGHGAAVSVRDFGISPGTVRLGDRITITASLVSQSSDDQQLVVDYRVHYARAGGKISAKVFKWKNLLLAGGETVSLAISQTIRDFTTRRHHPGRHDVELIINGQTVATSAFELLPAD